MRIAARRWEQVVSVVRAELRPHNSGSSVMTPWMRRSDDMDRVASIGFYAHAVHTWNGPSTSSPKIVDFAERPINSDAKMGSWNGNCLTRIKALVCLTVNLVAFPTSLPSSLFCISFHEPLRAALGSIRSLEAGSTSPHRASRAGTFPT